MGEARRSTFIVANDQYADRRLSQLRAPAADARELAAVLGDPDIGGFEVDLSVNEPEHVVRRRLSAFFDDRGVDDFLLLHLSCHGVKDEDGRLYFATPDTELDHLEATSIPSEFVNRLMTRTRSRRVVLLLDCCYSGAFARGLMSRAGDRVDLKERFDGRGRIVLTASSAMEYSFEGGELSGSGSPSVFTSALVRGLATGEADRNRDGFISVDELYDFAYDEVRAATPSQTPGKWVFDVQGDFVVARSRLEPEPEPEPEPPPEAQPEPEPEPAVAQAPPVERLVPLAPSPAPSVVEPPGPAWVTRASRLASAVLLAVVPVMVLAFGADDPDDGWNLWAVLSPVEVLLVVAGVWWFASALGAGLVATSRVAGLLLSWGALCWVGAAGLVKFSAQRVDAVAVVLSVLVLAGATVVLAAGVACLRSATGTARAARVDASSMVLGLGGAGLAALALFQPYDGFSSLITELGEGDSAEFAFVPAIAVALALVGMAALSSWPSFGEGVLVAAGAQLTLHYVGVLVAAHFAVGEVGETRAAGFIGLVAGLLVAGAGLYSRGAARTPV